jgi:hypothetical protein
MPRTNPGPPCQVCGKPSHSKNLCNTHYMRWHRHGHVEATRPPDWGGRESHPLYGIWCWTKRTGIKRAESWDDFYRFVADVGEKPSPKHRLKRQNNKEGFGPQNWFWHEPLNVDKDDLNQKAAAQREWRKRNVVKVKGYDLKRGFGLSLEQYHAMVESQKGCCAICNKQELILSVHGKMRSLAVDHCHATGKVRGLLCTNCNKALGHFKDDVELMSKAIQYLSK